MHLYAILLPLGPLLLATLSRSSPIPVSSSSSSSPNSSAPAQFQTYTASANFTVPANSAPFLTLAGGNAYTLTPSGALTVTNAQGTQLWTSGTGPYACTPGSLTSCNLSFISGTKGSSTTGPPALVLNVAGETVWTSATAPGSSASSSLGLKDGTVVPPSSPQQQQRPPDLVFAQEPYIAVYSVYGDVLWQAGGLSITGMGAGEGRELSGVV